MPAALPQLKTNELIAMLRAVDGVPDAKLELAHIKSEANKLLKTQATASDGYVILGIIASMEGAEIELRKNFTNAIRLSPGDSTFAELNFAARLLELGHVDEALGMLERVHNRDPLDLAVFQQLLSYSVLAGRIRKYSKYTDSWNTLTGKPHGIDAPDREALNRTIARLDELGVDDDALSIYVVGARIALRAGGFHILGGRVSYLYDGSVFFKYVIGDSDIERASAILIDYKVQSDAPALDDVFTLACEAKIELPS